MDQYKLDPDSLKALEECIIKGSNYRFTVLTERLIRIEYSPNNEFNDNATELVHNRHFEKPEFSVEEDIKYLVIKTSYFTLQYTKGKPFIGPKVAPDANLKIMLNETEKYWFFNHPEARNFLGSNVRLTKKLTRGLYSTDGFFSIDDSKSMMLDQDGFYIGHANQAIDTYVFLYRRDFGFALKDYYGLTGKAPLIPRYALGIWWNRDLPYNYSDVQKLVTDFYENKIPLSVLILNNSFSENNNYQFDSKLYSNPKEMFSYMHERGIKVGLTINPDLGIKPNCPYYDNLKAYSEVKDGSNIPINVYNKEFITNYFKLLITPLFKLGADFFFLDYEGKSMELIKGLNHYFFNYDNNNENKRGMILANNTNVAGHLYPVSYSGKTLVNWKTLQYLPYFNSSASNIGLSWWSHDIGGFFEGTEESELYIRYVELGCFSPIFRFSATRGHYYKREPWRWDANTLNIVSYYCNLRHRLIPYIYNEAYRYHRIGLPLCQPIYYVYPEIYDEPLYKNEYYFGSSMFVAPVTKRKDPIMNRSVEHLFLPEGTWYDFKTGKKFPGDKRYITFQNDEDYPVYVKSGGIIPLAILDHINDTNTPDKLEVHIFPGESSSYNLYEDDGITSMYEDGYYIITKFEYNYLPNNYTLTIRPIEGKSGIIPDERSYKIVFRNIKAADLVKVNVMDTEIDFISYKEGNNFIIEVPPVSTTSQLSINCRGKDIEIDAVRLINEEIDSIISDLQIETSLKERISSIIFGSLPLSKKRIQIRKLKREGLSIVFIKMFLKLLEYVEEL